MILSLNFKNTVWERTSAITIQKKNGERPSVITPRGKGWDCSMQLQRARVLEIIIV